MWGIRTNCSSSENTTLVGGAITILKNMSSSMGRITSLFYEMENKIHVWNHQPDNCSCSENTSIDDYWNNVLIQTNLSSAFVQKSACTWHCASTEMGAWTSWTSNFQLVDVKVGRSPESWTVLPKAESGSLPKAKLLGIPGIMANLGLYVRLDILGYPVCFDYAKWVLYKAA